MITNRSNHMPIFTKMARINDARSDVRIFLDQNNCGAIRLQVIIVQYAHQYGPKARLMKAKPSYGFALYHAMKNSIA